MVNYPRNLFKEIGKHCGYCSLYDDNNQEREKNKLSVRKNLEYLAKSFNENGNEQIIEEALNICKECEKCDYKNPSVFHFLEKKGFRVS